MVGEGGVDMSNGDETIVLGVALDEGVSVAVGRVVGGVLEGYVAERMVSPIKAVDQRVDQVVPSALQPLLAGSRIANKLGGVRAIAVSSIGLVSADLESVMAVARSGWHGFGEQRERFDLRSAVADASPVLAEKLSVDPGQPDAARFLVCNDMSARAVLEITYRKGGPGRAKEAGAATVYIRVDEGVNAGVLIGGVPVRGGLNTELGHYRVPSYFPDRTASQSKAREFKGRCAYHMNCVEGMCSLTALLERWDLSSLQQLVKHKLAMDIVAHDIAQICAVSVLSVAPQEIIIGGRLASVIVPGVRAHLKTLIGPYPDYRALQGPEFVKQAQIPDRDANLFGALELARMVALGEVSQNLLQGTIA